jgi:hypothetical protein
MLRYTCDLCGTTVDHAVPPEWRTFTTTVMGGQTADAMQPLPLPPPPVCLHVCPSHSAVVVKLVSA